MDCTVIIIDRVAPGNKCTYGVQSISTLIFVEQAGAERTGTNIKYVGWPKTERRTKQVFLSPQPETWQCLWETQLVSLSPTSHSYDTDAKFHRRAHHGCKPLAHGTVHMGTRPCHSVHKLNNQTYQRHTNGQNDKMDHWHCGCSHHYRLERPALKLSMQPTQECSGKDPSDFQAERPRNIFYLGWLT